MKKKKNLWAIVLGFWMNGCDEEWMNEWMSKVVCENWNELNFIR